MSDSEYDLGAEAAEERFADEIAELRVRVAELTDAARAVNDLFANRDTYIAIGSDNAKALLRLRAVLDDRPNPEVAAFLERELPTVDENEREKNYGSWGEMPSEETPQPLCKFCGTRNHAPDTDCVAVLDDGSFGSLSDG